MKTKNKTNNMRGWGVLGGGGGAGRRIAGGGAGGSRWGWCRVGWVAELGRPSLQLFASIVEWGKRVCCACAPVLSNVLASSYLLLNTMTKKKSSGYSFNSLNCIFTYLMQQKSLSKMPN